MLLETAEELAGACASLGVGLVFKSSYDKANRTSGGSGRGPGMEAGLAALAAVRSKLGLPVLTDVHEPSQAEEAAQAVDMLQIPAFLCRQTDLLAACGATGRPVNIKKGQFLAPEDMGHAARKALDAGAPAVALCERGTCFGYRDLVVDMRALVTMRGLGHPVVYDATHSVQRPGSGGGETGGARPFAAPLARAAVAAGISGVFIETHPDPKNAISDRAVQLPLERFRDFLGPLAEIDRCVKRDHRERWLENSLPA